MSRTTRLLRPAAASALSLLAALSAHAAPPNLRLTPTFGNALLPGGWQEMTVQVDNPADSAPLDGVVTLQLRDPRYPGRFDAAFSTRLSAAPGASVTVKIPVRVLERSLPNITAVLQDGVGDRARVVTSKLFDGIPARVGLLPVLAVTPDGDPAALEYLRGARLGLRRDAFTLSTASDRSMSVPMPNASSGMDGPVLSEPVVPIPLAQADLPTDVVAYDPLVAVALGEDVAPTPAQQAALDAFVRRGGVVVDARDLTPERLRRALSHSIGVSPIHIDLEGWGEEPLYPHAPVLQTSLLRHKGLEAPPVGTLLIFLAGYLILAVPVQYTILRRIDRRELAWVVTPALAVGFSIAAYSFARVGRPTAISYNAASVVETTSGSPTATQTGALGIYSPVSARYDVSLARPQTVLWHQGPDTARFTAQVDPARAVAQDVAISQWSMQPVRFRSESVPLGDGVTLDVDFDRATGIVDVRIQNNTGQRLRNARLRLGQHVLAVGEITAGGRAQVRQALPLPEHWSNVANGYELQGNHYGDQPLNELAQMVAMHRTSRPMLVAQVDALPLPVAVDGRSIALEASTHLLVVTGDLKK